MGRFMFRSALFFALILGAIEASAETKLDTAGMKVIGTGPLDDARAVVRGCSGINGSLQGNESPMITETLVVTQFEWFPPVMAQEAGPALSRLLPNATGKVYPVRFNAYFLREPVNKNIGVRASRQAFNRQGFVVQDKIFKEWSCKTIEFN